MWTCLVYRATASIQFKDSSFTLPVVKDGKLVGIMVRYDNTSNSAEIVPSPIIEHFIKDAAQAPYEGFPRTGMMYSNTRDPQLRRYVGLNGKHSVSAATWGWSSSAVTRATEPSAVMVNARVSVPSIPGWFTSAVS